MFIDFSTLQMNKQGMQEVKRCTVIILAIQFKLSSETIMSNYCRTTV